MNATLNPEVLRWARNKAGLSEETLAERVGVTLGIVKEWEATGSIPAPLVEKLAEKTRIAFGFLFLEKPPQPSLPIADFRHVGDVHHMAPSDDLLDVIYRAQLKQKWYREYLVSRGENPLEFVGKTSIERPVNETAAEIRATLNIGFALAETTSDWEETWRSAVEATEEAGILVLCAGYAGGFTHRKLSVDEFRGFAITDEYAPLIFINGADAPAARFFTLAHEVVHIWIGKTGVSNLQRTYADGNAIETYCNSVAAEILLPINELHSRWRGEKNDLNEVARLASKYKVSRLVVARRARDAGFLTPEKYNSYFRLLISQYKKSSGGSWYLNEKYQNSRKFSIAIIQESLAGRTMEREAMQLLGIKKEATFRKYAGSLQGESPWPIF